MPLTCLLGRVAVAAVLRAAVARPRPGAAALPGRCCGQSGGPAGGAWLALVVGLCWRAVRPQLGRERTGTPFAWLAAGGSHAADAAVAANGTAQGYDPGPGPPARGERRWPGMLRGAVGNVSLVLPGGARVPSHRLRSVSADGQVRHLGRPLHGASRAGCSAAGRADEVVIDPQLPRPTACAPGSTLRLLIAPAGPRGARPAYSRAVQVPLRVVGRGPVRQPDRPGQPPATAFPALALTPAFYRSRPGPAVCRSAGDEALVRLRPGTSLGGIRPPRGRAGPAATPQHPGRPW